jgi:pimeloyl-ACP methyl ester carboxylesterase
MRAWVGALHAVLPDSRMVVLPGQAHAGFRTAPKLVAAEVRKFLGRAGEDADREARWRE